MSGVAGLSFLVELADIGQTLAEVVQHERPADSQLTRTVINGQQRMLPRIVEVEARVLRQADEVRCFGKQGDACILPLVAHAAAAAEDACGHHQHEAVTGVLAEQQPFDFLAHALERQAADAFYREAVIMRQVVGRALLTEGRQSCGAVLHVGEA